MHKCVGVLDKYVNVKQTSNCTLINKPFFQCTVLFHTLHLRMVHFSSHVLPLLVHFDHDCVC